MVAMFSEYCGKGLGDASKKFSVEPGLVLYPDDRLKAFTPAGQSCREVKTPDMSSRQMECSVEYVNSVTGIKPHLDGPHMCKLLTKMQLTASISPSNLDTMLVD